MDFLIVIQYFQVTRHMPGVMSTFKLYLVSQEQPLSLILFIHLLFIPW